jgi:hypothetical protein
MECAERIRASLRLENTMRTTSQTTPGRFIFDQRRHDEDERLASMEHLWDPGPRR